MIEVFAGTAVLCSIAKQYGLVSSLAIDKVKKRGARSTIFQLDLTCEKDQSLLEQWMQSPLLLWVHLAPVCGTASRARNIRRFHNDPKPLRSDSAPEGLEGLDKRDQQRVNLANSLFAFACRIFYLAASKGVLVTMENPSNSFFWLTRWVRKLLSQLETFETNFQVCMYGGSRDKWTKILANFKEISAMDIKCNRLHQHAAWGFAFDEEGKQVWATSLESRYTVKLCVVLTSLVLQVATDHNLQLRASDLTNVQSNPLQTALHSQVGAERQPKPSRMPPLVPNFSSVATFVCKDTTELPCGLQSKLSADLQFFTKAGRLETVPKYSRLLRISALNPDLLQRGSVEGQDVAATVQPPKRQKVDESSCSFNLNDFSYEVAFGMPWDWQAFVQRACNSEHPFLQGAGVPAELEEAINLHVAWSPQQMSKYRLDWCKEWLMRAKELEGVEKECRESRPAHVAELTKLKRVSLTKEILTDIGYSDISCLDLIESGSTLAGDIEQCNIFRQQYKPCLMTLEQLARDAPRRNEYILKMTVSAGSAELDRQVLEETREELNRGWAEGPFELHQLEEGATKSRRFPLVQGSKTRMIDDFSISGVNDSSASFNKVDLHVVDTFSSVVKRFFSCCQAVDTNSLLEGKTYDLKSAYRQVPIRADHLKYGYFSVFNAELRKPQIYRLRTLPFGAVHSVYSFLRLARMLYAIAVQGLKLLTTNFYDDFILASPPSLKESAQSGMELVFMLTGWEFARTGKKSTEFGLVCKALGVEFNFALAGERVLQVGNTATRRDEIIAMISAALDKSCLDKATCLTLRGKLGFADSFLHGRLGALVLKRLSEHAYGRTSKLDTDLILSLEAMRLRLQSPEPRRVTCSARDKWFIYTDASYEPESKTGGLGGVMVDSRGSLVSWFGFALDEKVCKALGGETKDTLIYELELFAAVLSFLLWCKGGDNNIYVWFGDNDSVRYALIKASGTGAVATALLQIHLVDEAKRNSLVWFARVPTEANFSDYPSRLVPHPFLDNSHCCNSLALERFNSMMEQVVLGN